MSGLAKPDEAKQPKDTKSLPYVSYLKTWVSRTKSDVSPIKENISTYPQTAISLCDDFLNNLNELEKYLEGLE